jgi:hypothetical protein
MFIGYANTFFQGSGPPEPYSKLVFLVEDWNSPISYEFGYHDEKTQAGPKNFMKEQLNVTDGMIPEVRNRREQILSSFQEIGCYLSPYPGNDLGYYDKVKKLDPLFISTIKDFVSRIIDPKNITTKKFGGKEINCEYFKQYVGKLADYFENTQLPKLKSLNDSTTEIHNQFAYSSALKLYRDEMDKVMNNLDGLADKKFKEFHIKNKNKANAKFNEMKRFERDELQIKYFKYLQDGIQQAFDSYQLKMDMANQKRVSEGKKRKLKAEMKRPIYCGRIGGLALEGNTAGLIMGPISSVVGGLIGMLYNRGCFWFSGR